MSSPAERYAAARRRQAASRSELARFMAGYDFPFDDFQVRGCEALERGEGVLVAAPTGAGKTVVGEFAIHLALAKGLKAFYTAPIKALSNQKYLDLLARHGAERVGLLTGDTSVNPHADIIVMTTEVLRNMLYSGSRDLDRLGFVVMDEVHYLAARCGRRSSSTWRPRCRWCPCRRPSRTPRSSATGSGRCAAARLSSSASTGRCP